MPRPLVGKFLDPVVGLASEAYAHHKSKSRSPSPGGRAASGSTTAPPPPGSSAAGQAGAGPSSSSQQQQQQRHDLDEHVSQLHPEGDPHVEDDEENWELDDVAQAVGPLDDHPDRTSSLPHAKAPPPSHPFHGASDAEAGPAAVPKGNWAGPSTVETLVSAFVTVHPPRNRDPSVGAQLALPVVIPQRRPHRQSRGFVKAYAPVLGDVGIDQEEWMDFLNSTEESIKIAIGLLHRYFILDLEYELQDLAQRDHGMHRRRVERRVHSLFPVISPIFYAVNFACFVVGTIPTLTTQVISQVVGTTEIIVQEAYQRYRHNSFLSAMNDAYFKPQGLYCLLMSYKPDSDAGAQPLDLSSTVTKAVDIPQDGFSGAIRKLRPTQGQSRGDAQIQAVAPLIYPQLDAASEEQKQNSMKRGYDFVRDYVDRREQAKFADEHPESVLADRPQFQSDHADPQKNFSESLPRSRVSRMIEARMAARRQRPSALMTVGHKIAGKDVNQYSTKRPIDFVKRRLKPDVVYMLVVPMPSDQEMNKARAALAEKS